MDQENRKNVTLLKFYQKYIAEWSQGQQPFGINLKQPESESEDDLLAEDLDPNLDMGMDEGAFANNTRVTSRCDSQDEIQCLLLKIPGQIQDFGVRYPRLNPVFTVSNVAFA
jgi:hypothetical protein